MTANRLLLIMPFLVTGLLLVLVAAMGFNGLYGQDAHEYLRLSQAYFGRLCGQAYTPEGLGDSEFAGGYPLAGALLQGVGIPPTMALQMVSALSAGAALWLFERLLRLLSPGSSARSKLLYMLLLAFSPAWVRAGMTVMSDALGLALGLAAIWQGLRALERYPPSTAVWAAGLGGLALTTRFAWAALLLPLGVAVAGFLFQKKKWGWLAAAAATAGAAMILHGWIKSGVTLSPLQHSMFADWSLRHFFQSDFTNANGAMHYTLPNGLYLLFPLAHPAFCLLLPGLFFFSKRTDAHLFSKKLLLVCLASYLLLLGGLPHQNVRFLLPAYVVVLLLLFPAWDRMVSYGLYFFKRLTWGILIVLTLVQGAGIGYLLAPVFTRHRLEVALAAELRSLLPPNAVLFAFDIDVALRSYLPDVQIKNLWVRRYDDFPAGSFFLFNEPALREQWAGQNPMLNWEQVQRQGHLEEKKMLPSGWRLYRVEK